MKRYEHKVVLITGAGDIAGATARRLLSEGGKVALTEFFPGGTGPGGQDAERGRLG